jgi:hypothetical protein
MREQNLAGPSGGWFLPRNCERPAICGIGCIVSAIWKFAILDGGLNRWWANFATNGYPSIVPWYSISAEFIGAILLIPGIYSRWVCLYTLPLIAGAAQFWSVRKGFSLPALAANFRLFGQSCLRSSIVG